MTAEARWELLRSFVQDWYAQPLPPLSEELEGSGPLALREWFTLVGKRVKSEFFRFPRKIVFSRWPELPARKRSLLESDLERGVLEVIDCGGHGGWGLSIADDSDDPLVHQLELEGETSEPFTGTLSELLTQAVILETAAGVPMLGRLRKGVREFEAVEGEGARAYLSGFDSFPGMALGGVLLGPEGDTLVQEDEFWVLTKTPEASAKLEALIKADEDALSTAEEEAAAARAAEKKAKLAEIEGVPTTGPELLAALEGIEDKLLRFQKAFLTDFRRQVTTGTASAGLLLKAGEILEARWNA